MKHIVPARPVGSPATLRVEKRGAVLRAVAAGDWLTSETPRLNGELAAVDIKGVREAEIDGSAIEALDSAGIWLLIRLRHALEAAGAHVTKFAVPDRYASLLSALERDKTLGDFEVVRRHRTFKHLLERTGQGTLTALRQAYDLVGFLGRVAVETTRSILEPRKELPIPALVHQIEETGVTALPIVGLLAFLIGIVIAYEGADQLGKIVSGAQIYTIDLLGVLFLRELGVLVTAIIVAGRSGSAFTAHIGTMRVNEEVDAMQTLGLNVTELLIVPRILGLVIALPFLTLFADVVGIAGGMVMTYFNLGITIPVFMREFEHAVSLNTFLVGLVKAPVFAFVIALVGCFEGLRVQRNAASVGLLTTRSVVESIFLVIACDAGFAVLFSTLGI